MSGACRIAVRIVLTINPGGLELPTGAGALLVHGATHATTNVTHQADTTGRLGLGAAHGDMERADLDRRAIWHCSAGRGAFTPEERHTKVRTACTACEAGIIGH